MEMLKIMVGLRYPPHCSCMPLAFTYTVHIIHVIASREIFTSHMQTSGQGSAQVCVSLHFRMCVCNY